MMYEFIKGMSEISGFGNGYEDACRSMLRAGMTWLDKYPDSKPVFSSFKGIYGYINTSNDDAKSLEKAILSACPDCTGAMFQAVVSHCLYIRKNGWDSYVKMMSKGYAG